MKGCFIYRLNHDVQNIIELMLHHYRVKNTNKEYRHVFHFFDNVWDGYICPNPHGRCVGRWWNATVHCLDGQFHRKDGPAIEWTNGNKYWYVDGELHRLDGPAIENADGHKYWYYNGQLHREDGPAIEFANGSKYWYYEDKLHRLDGPAFECANGNKYWYYEDKLHRLDGPAIERANGTKEWYVNGTKKMVS